MNTGKTKESMQKGIVFNIQRCSIHDGPGIRTLIFLKGCPLNCIWCSNPESQDSRPEIASFHKRCINCGECVKACPNQAIEYKDGVYKIDDRLCDRCGKCVSVCYAESKQMIGTEMRVRDVMLEIEKDRPFYKKTGGGVTFSGGEPLSQADFLISILKSCKKNHIHTALETCGYADPRSLLEASKYLDLIYFDIKQLDPEKHRLLTGVSNEMILGNLKKLDAASVPVVVRVPIVPGYNDSIDFIQAVAGLCAQLRPIKRIELLAYHNLGSGKYASINRKYHLGDLKKPDKQTIEKLAEVANSIAAGNRSFCEVVQS